MKSTSYTSEDLCRMKYIVLGRQMENNYRQITFDLSDILEEIPDVETISLVHMRSRDLGEYPAVTSSESPLVWTITDTDTAYYGYGKAEIRFTFGDGGLAKTLTFKTLVFKSITADTIIPEPLQSWYDALIEYIDEHSVSPEQIEQAVADYLDEHPVEAPVTSVNGEIGAVVLTASDVGALPDTYTAPVTSVNARTGAVVLTASDVGALPSSTPIPTKTSDLTNDSGYLSSAVTTWNGQSGAVTYTAPVTKVNNKTGAVNLTASDVGALPSTTVVPTRTSQLTNDSGYITSAPVASVDGKTGAVTILPTGGSSGQVLTKRTGSNYDVQWTTVSGGGAVDSVNGQTGTVVLTASDVGALPDTTDVEDVYWCTYGTTTSAQIETALTAGKIPMVSYNNYVYTLRNRNSATNHRFVCNYGGKEYTIVCQSGTWMPDGTLTFLTTNYTAPVTSVNGQTGAVTVSVPVSSVDGKTGTVTVIPTGGSTGQVLAKASNTDRDVEWITPASGGGDTWRVIADITTTEEVLSISITQDSNGNSFALKEFRVFASVPKCTQASNGQWGVNSYWMDSTGGFNTGSGRHGSFAMKLNPDNTATSMFEQFGIGGYNTTNFSTINGGFYDGRLIEARAFPNGFTEIKLRQSNTSYNLPIGTHIYVYGVDKS